MTNEWMLDVLADLKAFSGKNGLTMTEEQIGQVMAVAAAEISSKQGMMPGTVQRGYGDFGECHRESAKGANPRRTQ